MILRLMMNELSRRRGTLLAVFLFLFLSSLLTAGGAALIAGLSSALDGLFETARVPHFVQMHAGDLDDDAENAIAAWAARQPPVAEYQIVRMISIDGSSLTLPGGTGPETESVMDLSLVRQNRDFDYLVDTDNRLPELARGEIGVPVYYAEERGVSVGDTLTLERDGFVRSLRISAILRDAQMNPAIVHSKRFLVHPDEYDELAARFPESEYLIEFRLTDPERLEEFSRNWRDSGLPAQGPAVDIGLFRLLNGLSDGVVSAVVIILSLLLMTVALLALRLVMLAALEEDYREIGVMKAIGMPAGSIRGLYTAKYSGLAAGAAVSGYLASFPLRRLLTAGVTRYIGDPALDASGSLIPLLAVLMLFMLIYLAVILILRRFRTISAVDALRASRSSGTKDRGPRLTVADSRLPDLNIFLGLRDAVRRFRLYGLLLFIFIVAGAVTLIPVHFLTTLQSPDFIRYMGIGRADIRIDLRAAEGTGERFEAILAAIAADDEVARFSPHVASVFDLPLPDGTFDEIRIESGEFATFPLEYLAGRAPRDEKEIALSLLYSRDLELTVGDPLTLLVEGSPRELTVTGIYQDITNGGRTSKSPLAPDPERTVGYSLSLDLVPGSDPAAKVAAYSERFRPARVTELEAYLDQTLGSTIAGLSRISTGAVLIGTLVAVLITSLFLRMLIARDGGRIAIMRSLGFSLAALKKQYLTSALLLLSLGIGAGALLANTIGRGLVSFIWSFLGASRITFVIDPLLAYLMIPALLACGVAAATVVSISGMRETTIAARVAE